MSSHQCLSCGGFCKKSGCERENVKQPTVTRKMITAAHGVVLEKGCIMLSADILTRIYIAMREAEE